MADEDVYDLSEDPAPPKPPGKPAAAPSPAAPAKPGAGATAAPVGTLGYARPGTANSGAPAQSLADARGSAADPDLLRREHRRNQTVPVILSIAGGLLFVLIALLITRDPLRAGVWLGLSLGWDVLVIALGLLAGSWFVDLEVDSPRTLLLHILALTLAFSAIFWPILWIYSGTLCGYVVAWSVALIVFCWLLSYFFELEVHEVLLLAVVILVVRLAANFVYWNTFGTFGYLP